MRHRTQWLCMAALASCAATPGDDCMDPAGASVPRSLFATSIQFEPALPGPGALSIAHESGWSLACAAPPSGVDVRMPEGPANLILRIGEQVYERTVKVAQTGNAFVWHWRR